MVFVVWRKNVFIMVEVYVVENFFIVMRNFVWYFILFFFMGILEFGGIFGM